MIGQTIAHYQITARIGAGGMGEVYRARDTKLGRDVALKVLPEAFARDVERMARFEREAKVLASLNHPNIATIHGLEESGNVRALVMELVEGPTLADRIAQGPIPLDEALPIAKQICDALEYAHERGIVHRDLKPANVKITPDGMVKLLDFGLAKALEGDSFSGDISTSPTISRMATQAGIILGTAAYMSPEQAKGRPVDRRADIWAFGCVLYEMLTGKKPFEGETISDVLAAVIAKEPDWAALPPGTPRRLRELLERCLTKDLRQRLQSIGEARIAIEKSLSREADAVPVATAVPVIAAPPLWRRVLPWTAAGVLALALAVSLFVLLQAPVALAPSLARFPLDIGNLNLVTAASGSRIAISPDGRNIVFVATESGLQTQQLYLRSMDNESITPLADTQGAEQPFFSPDSRWVGFSANGKLEKVPLGGGLPVTLCGASGNSGVQATWADNDFIYFITTEGKVDRVSAGGGTPQPVAGADPGKLPYAWISSLPGSRGLLLVAVAGLRHEFDIDVLSLETGTSRRLIENGSWPRYLPTGQIIYEQFSSSGGLFTAGLLAVPFDLKSLARTGSPIPVMEGVATVPGGAGIYDVAADGTLVYYPGGGAAGIKRLAWLDSKGVHALARPPGNYSNLSISPDGKRVVLTVAGSSQDIYIYDLIRDRMQRLTFNGQNDFAIFTPDESRVVYGSTGESGNVPNLWMRTADGSGNAERLTTSKFAQRPGSISPDGKLLAYYQLNPKTGYDLYVLPLEGNHKPQVFLQAPSFQLLPVFSPDGKRIAYMSNESGTMEIFVRSFPGPGGKHQISVGSGTIPVWSRDGKKLYYNSGNNLMEVDITNRPSFSAGTPRLLAANLLIAQDARNFDVAPDGRILIAQSLGQSHQGSPQLHVVLNFATEVQNRLAAAKQ